MASLWKPRVQTPLVGRASKYRVDIQGLRGIAVLAVVAYHAGFPVTGGFIGVDVFFVISGYVISMSIAEQRSRGERFSFWTFMWRRYRRLAPALGVMVLIVGSSLFLFASPLGSFQYNAEAGVMSLLYLSNVLFSRIIGDYFAQSAQSNVFLNTWSLSVEEQFYLLFALAMIICAGLIARHLVFVRVLIIAALATSFLFSLASTSDSLPVVDHLVGFFSPISRAWEFMIGVLSYLTFRGCRLRSGYALLATSASFVLLFWCLVFMPQEIRWPGPVTVMPVLATAAILVIGGADKGSGRRAVDLLASPSLTWVGDRSYSIYLWHWPLLVVFTVFLDFGAFGIFTGLVLSVILGALSYRLVEQRWRSARWSLRKFSKLFVVSTVTPLLVLVVLQMLAPKVVQQTWPEAPPLGTRSLGLQDCLATVSTEQALGPRVEQCTFGGSFTGTPLYLVGDSQAAHFTEALIAAGEQLGRPVSVLTAPSCPQIDVFFRSNRGDERLAKQCRRHFEIVQGYLRSAPQGTVIIAESPGYWIRDDIAVAQSTTTWFGDRVDIQLALFEGLARAAEHLSDVGHEVVLLEPLPQFVPPGPTISPIDCSLLEMLASHCALESEVNEIPDEQVAVLQEFKKLPGGSRVRAAGVQEQICPEGLCEFYGSGVPLYSDNTHLSSEFSRELGSRFVEILRQPASAS